MRRKLSASAISTFLESPRKYYYRYIYNGGVEPIGQSVGDFSHDRILGSIWSEFVDRFYKGVSEADNTAKSLASWHEQVEGWVPPKVMAKYTEALATWAMTYYQQFDPKDGVRNGSEKLVENERFLGYLDGLSANHKIIHENKSTSRAQNLSEQMLKVQTSLQIKLYAVLTRAEGVLIEFAFKDAPYAILRTPIYTWTPAQIDAWELQFNALADTIWALGNNPNHYLCVPENCSIIGRGMTSICGYQSLCLGIDGCDVAFQTKTNRRK